MRASVMIFQTLSPLLSARVFPAPRAETADQTVPYATYQKITSNSENTLDAWTGHDYVRVQVDVWHNTLNEAEILGNQVKSAITNQTLCAAELADTRDTYDETTKLHGQSIDFMIWQTACDV